MMDKEVERNQQVSREEYDRFWEKHFKMQDADTDGLLKPDEYKPAVIFQHIDADADGTITLQEYQAGYVSHFKKRDENADDVLDESEIWKVK
jgi:Ca2+-binding EF-hand superfamily protein